MSTSPKLQPRWCGLSRDQVAANQRRRLLEAMLELAGDVGYARVTVKSLSALAGVSRRSFYDCFPVAAGGEVKQRCLLAAYDHAVEQARIGVREAYRGERNPQRRLDRGVQALLGEVAARPRSARVVLHEVYAAGPAALARTERARGSFEPMLAARPALSPLIAKGVVGAVEHVAARCPLAARDPQHAAAELSAWVAANLAAPARGLARTGAVAPAPVGPTRAWLERAEEPTRILRASAAIAAAHGYARLSPGRIAALLGISDGALAERDMEQCFLAALELLAAEALAVIRRAAIDGEDWADGLQRGVTALLGHLAARPLLGRLGCVEAYVLGPPALARIALLLSRFAALLRGEAPDGCAPSQLAAEASVAALWRLISLHVTRGCTRRLPAFAEHASYILLAPALGAQPAAERILRARGQRAVS
jgi:AcrR family transcriptional regulator